MLPVLGWAILGAVGGLAVSGRPVTEDELVAQLETYQNEKLSDSKRLQALKNYIQTDKKLKAKYAREIRNNDYAEIQRQEIDYVCHQKEKYQNILKNLDLYVQDGTLSSEGKERISTLYQTELSKIEEWLNK